MDEFLGPLVGGVQLLLEPSLWPLIAAGAIFGVVVGALPGLSTTLAYGLVLPFTFALDAVSAVTLLLAVTVGVSYGNSIPAILVGVPGTPAAVLTVLDGYALHRRGETGLALGLAYVAAAVGQAVSVVFFIAMVIPLSALAYYFLHPELFALYVFGIVAIVSLTANNLVKGLAAGAIGLLIGMVGLDPVNFVPRFDFGERLLRTGLNLPAVLVGILAVSELFRQSRQVFQWHAGEVVSAKFPSFKQIRPTLPSMVIGTAVGTVVGAIPGAGGTPASLIAYQQAQLISKRPDDFGRGAPDGVASNEAAQNAANSGELIPTLGLGIPASGSMALLLAALSLHGFLAGPALVRDAPQMMSAVVAGLLGGTIFLVLTGWPIAKVMVKALTINRSAVIILALATIALGIYSLNYRIFDVAVCFFFGAIGYFMLRYGYSTAAAALAVVLAAGLEATLRRGLSLFENDLIVFFTRPITAVILALALVFLVLGLRRALRFQRQAAEAEAEAAASHLSRQEH